MLKFYTFEGTHIRPRIFDNRAKCICFQLIRVYCKYLYTLPDHKGRSDTSQHQYSEIQCMASVTVMQMTLFAYDVTMSDTVQLLDIAPI